MTAFAIFIRGCFSVMAIAVAIWKMAKMVVTKRKYCDHLDYLGRWNMVCFKPLSAPDGALR